MQAFLKSLLGAFLGTSAMTAWSYAIARREKEQFREPVLLKEIVESTSKKIELKKNAKFTGWALHYLAGFAFTYAYHQLWKSKNEDPSIGSGIILGTVSGVIGITVWEQAFKLHPAPQKIDKKGYYQQLLVAHAIFGLFAALGYKAID